MDKYTIGTILGTVALGLIKSKIGSGTRLKLIWHSFIEEGIQIPYSDKDKVLKLIKEFEPMMNENGIFISNLEIVEIDGETVVIVLGLKKIVESDQELRRCSIWYDDDFQYHPYEYWRDGDTSIELEKFLYKTIIPEIKKITTIIDLDGDEEFYDSGYQRTLINTDTGEEYKPTKITRPKLRKR